MKNESVSTVLPDCLALLGLVAGLAALSGSIVSAVSASMYPLILPGAAGLIVCGYLALVALNPSTVNVSIVRDEFRPGDEAIGVLLFLAKCLLQAAPVAFGAGVLAGTLMLGWACCELFFAGNALSTATTTATARIILVGSAALPLAAYLLFLLCSLLLDLCRAILVPPAKLQVSAEEEEENGNGQ